MLRLTRSDNGCGQTNYQPPLIGFSDIHFLTLYTNPFNSLYMRIFYLVCCALVAQTSLFAQTLDESNIPNVGDTWRAFVLMDVYDRTAILPETGTSGGVFDFRFVNDEVVLADGTTFGMADPDSLVNLRILAPFTMDQYGEDEEIPVVPEGTVVTDYNIFEVGFRNLDDDNFEATFLQVFDDGVRQTGFACVEEAEVFDAEVDPDYSVVTLPFGLELGDTLRSEAFRQSIDEDGDTIRETSIRRYEVLATGMLRMPFGDYENAVMMSVFEEDEFDAPGFGFGISTEYITMHVPGSYLPILLFGIDNDRDESGELRDSTTSVVVFQPTNLVSVAERERAEFQVTAFPNPVTELLTVNFQSEAAGAVRANLVSVDGRVVASRDYSGVPQGAASVQFAVPASVVRGSYLLQLEQGGRTAAVPVVVER